MSKPLRITLIAIAVFAVLSIGAVFTLKTMLSPELLRQRASEDLTALLGRSVTISGPVVLHVFPEIYLSFEGLSVSNPDTFPSANPLCSVGKAEARLELAPLFKGKVHIQEIALKDMAINLVQTQDASNNWTFAKKDTAQEHGAVPSHDTASSTTASTQQPVKQQTTPSILPAWLSLNSLNIENASLHYHDEKSGTLAEINQFFLQVATVDTALQSLDTLKLRYSTKGTILTSQPQLAGQMSAKGELFHSAEQGMSLILHPFAYTPTSGVIPNGLGTLTLQARIEHTPSGVLNIQDLMLNGEQLSLKGTAQYTPATQKKKLSFTALLEASANPRSLLNHLGSDYLPTSESVMRKAHVQCSVQAQGKTIEIDDIKGNIDNTKLQGTLTLTMKQKPNLVGALHLGSCNVDNYLPREATTPAKEQKKESTSASSIKKKATANAPAPTWQTWKADVRATMEQLLISNIDITNIQTHLKLDEGTLRVEPLNALVAGGSVDAKMTAAMAQNPPHYTASLTTKDIAIGTLLLALTGKKQIEATGSLVSTLSASGIAMPALLKTLSGTADLDIVDIVILDKKLAFSMQQASKQSWRKFQSLTATFNAQNGVVRSNDLKLLGNALTITGDGYANLPANTLASVGTVYIKGLPAIPVRVRGTLTDPKFGLDPARILKNTFKDTEKLIKQPNEVGGKLLEGIGKLINTLGN